MSFDRIARLMLGISGLLGARSLRGAGYNALRISRALQSKPQKRTRRAPQKQTGYAPNDQDQSELETMAKWLKENALGRLPPNQRGFVANVLRLIEAGRTLSPKQEQWLRSIYAKQTQRDS